MFISPEGFEGCEQPVHRKAMLFTTYYDVGGTLTLLEDVARFLLGETVMVDLEVKKES
jgi:hypothetical protein